MIAPPGLTTIRRSHVIQRIHDFPEFGGCSCHMSVKTPRRHECPMNVRCTGPCHAAIIKAYHHGMHQSSGAFVVFVGHGDDGLMWVNDSDVRRRPTKKCI